MNNYYKNKANDFNKEKQVSHLLVESFFKPFLNSTDPIQDKEKQLAGIDIETPVGNIDLKSALTRLDGSLETFCLELFFRNGRGELHPGWFYNHKKTQTDYYSFNYHTHSKLTEHNRNDKSIKYMRDISDIGTSELVIVSKEKLVKFIAPYWTNELKQKIQQLMNSEFSNTRIVIDKFVKVVYSKQLNEKPVNFIVSKEKLIELADMHVFINHKNDTKEILKSSFTIH